MKYILIFHIIFGQKIYYSWHGSTKMRSKSNTLIFFLFKGGLHKINFKHNFLKQLVRLRAYFKCILNVFKFKKYVEYNINLHAIII